MCEKFERRHDWQNAYDCCSIIADDAAHDVGERLERYRSSCYDELCAEYESAGRVSDDFYLTLLDGYRDAAQYRILCELSKCSWDTDYEKAVSLLYSLGDFKDMQKTGFIPQRLFSQRWESSGGYYFRSDEIGEPEYNLPAYRYNGYYGLYSRFDKNEMSIGSDEKQFWRSQFRFEFFDNDSRVEIYSYAANTTYTLYRQP